jgi:RHS repeat-associated protein
VSRGLVLVRARFSLAIASLLVATQLISTVPVVRAAAPPSTGPSPTLPSELPSPVPSPSSSSLPSPAPSSVPEVESAAPSPSMIFGPASPSEPSPNSGPKSDPGLKPGATEIVLERTETSQTFDNHDGTKTTRLFAGPVFYQAEGSSAWEAIDVGFAASSKVEPLVGAVPEVSSTKARAAVSVFSSASKDFVAIDGNGVSIGFGLPLGSVKVPVLPVPTLENQAVDYVNYLPDTDLRVFARPTGSKSFIVLRNAPSTPMWTFRVDAPGLKLVAAEDGSIDIVDGKGDAVASIPKPYAVDSTPDELSGGGRYTDQASVALGADVDGAPTITISADPDWLAKAIYPVYVDPSVVLRSTNNTFDAHTASLFPNSNYNIYQRPDAPGYYEMWLGTDPSGTSGTSYDFIQWDLSSIGASTIDSASISIHPYHQYYNSPTVVRTWVDRVTTDTWTAGTIKWSNQPSHFSSNLTFVDSVEGSTTSSGSLISTVQGWVDGTYANNGLRLWENGNGSTYWKRIISTSDSTNVNWRPTLTVDYHVPTVTDTTPKFSGSITWNYSDAPGNVAQTKFHVDIATTQANLGTTNVATSGDVSSADTAWLINPGAMLDDGVYWYRVRVRNGTSWSSWSTPAQFTYDTYRRGDESYYTRIPFDLSGSWSLDVGTNNGEASLSRSLFEIPSFGPAQALEVAYSSAGPNSAGMLGSGWTSNLTQYLTFENGLVVWHRADGGRVAFPGTGGGAYGGHFESLVVGATDVITLRDQTKLAFQSTGAGHLLSIANRFGKALTLASWGTTTVTATDSSGRATTLAVDTANSRINSVTDSAGRLWSFTYNGVGSSSDLYQLLEPDPDGAGPLGRPTATFTYVNHQLTLLRRTRTKAAGGTDTIDWAIAYDGSLRVSTVTDPQGLGTVPVATNTFAYTAATSTTPAKTDVGLAHVYSPITRWASRYTLDGRGRATSILDPGGFTTNQTFDAKGNLISVARPVDVTHWATTSYTYDGAGNLVTETDPLTSSTSVTSVTTYNATNDLQSRSEADSDAAAKVVTLFGYDASGHLLSVTNNCTSSGTTLPSPASSCTGGGTHDATWNLVTSYVYASNDQVDVEWDPRGIATKHVYDSYGNETSTIVNCTTSGTTPPGRATSCTAAGIHDAATNVTTVREYLSSNNGGKIGLPSKITDPLGAVIAYDYDVAGERTSIVTPFDASMPQRSTTTTYDELGNVLTTTDTWAGIATNRTTTYVYELLGRVTTESGSASGTTTTRTFDAAGNETQTVSGGVTVDRTSFDWMGNALVEVTATGTADESQTTRTFDPQGYELTTLVNGDTTSRTYDYAGRLATDAADGITVTHRYDARGQETQTDTTGSASTYASFDRVGRTTRTTDEAGLKTDTVYDAAGNVVSVSHPYAGASATSVDTTDYDALDRPNSQIVNYVAGGTGPDENLTTSTVYDAAGNAIATQDPKGAVSVTTYNKLGLSSRVVTACLDASPPPNWWQCSGNGTQTQTQNLTTTLMYDGWGTLTASVEVRIAPPNAISTTVTDAAGRVVATKDPIGTINRTLYDAAGNVWKSITNCVDTTPPANWYDCSGTASQDGTRNLISTTTFDAAGRKSSETAPNGRVTSYNYDDAGQLIKRVDNDVPGTPGPAEDVTTEYHYDGFGRQDGIKDPAGRVTINHFDPASGFLTWTVVRCVDASPPGSWWQCTGTATADYQTNIKTTYGYDSAGRRTSMTAPDPSASQAGAGTATNENAYDVNGRLCRVLEAASPQTGLVLAGLADPCSTVVSGGTATVNLSTRYLYDDNGNVTTMTDAAGHSTGYGYDKDGNMTSLTDADGRAVNWTYDSQGHRLTQANRDGSSITWTYDEAGRLSTRTATGVVGVPSVPTVLFGYDLNGNRKTVSSGGPTITTTFDALNRPLAVTDNTDPGAATTYTYGLLSGTRTDPSHASAYSFTLDKFGREVAMVDPVHGAGSPWTTSYAADGQKASLAAPNGNTMTYGYDPAGRLVTMTTTAAGPVTRAAYIYTYNRAGQRLSENSQITGDTANGTATFGYDSLGRVTGFQGVSAFANQAYTWDKVPNRLSKAVGATTITTTFDAANHPVSDTTPATYSVDNEGRITSRPVSGGSQTLQYDALGRLISVTTSGSTTTYGYDPLDRLASITSGSAVSRLRYVGTSSTLAQVRDGSNVVRYGVGTGMDGQPRFDFDPTAAVQRFYGTNAHHDVTWTANASGSVTATSRYDPWGAQAVTSGTLPDLRFQSSWFDSGPRLYWAVKRWYSPDLGTFTTEDSLLGDEMDPSTRNLYAYGAGDPVGTWDPFGESVCQYDPEDCAALAEADQQNKAKTAEEKRLAAIKKKIKKAFARYDYILLYMFNEMKRNAHGHKFGYWQNEVLCHQLSGDPEFDSRWLFVDSSAKCPAGASDNAIMLAQWAGLVHGILDAKVKIGDWSINLRLLEPGEWDHKPKLLAHFHEPKEFWTPIRGDPRPERIRYDIWSNIHYGYVGRSHGIPRKLLDAAQRHDGGSNSDSDNLSVKIGMDLWDRKGFGLNPRDIQRAVVRNLDRYRTKTKNQVKPGWY